MQVNNILSLFKKNKVVNEVVNQIKNDKYKLYCNGMTFNHTILLASTLFKTDDKFIIYICDNAFHANQAYDTFCDILGYEHVNLYAVDDFIATEAIVISNELKQERLITIKNILENNPKVIVTHTSAITKPIISKGRFQENIINIKNGIEINVNEFVKRLVKIGYTRVDTTYNVGEFSLRGEVIDIYPACFENPIRINIGFDEVESIHYYYCDTQLTYGDDLKEINIFPTNEIILDENIDELEEKLINIENNDLIKYDFLDVKESGIYDKLNKYIDYIDKDNTSILEYFGNNYISLLNEIKDIELSNESLQKEISEYIVNRFDLKRIKVKFSYDLEKVLVTLDKIIYTSSSKRYLGKLELIGLYEFNGFKVIDYQNDFKVFVNDLKTRDEEIYICLNDENEVEIIKQLFDDNDIKYKLVDDFYNIKKNGINIIVCPNAIGFGIRDEYICLSKNEIFKKIKNKKVKYRSVKETSVTINSKDDLKDGDYVVHYDYGIGKYLGIKTAEFNGIINDYLQIQYENMNLLIPVDKINSLEKYIGSEGVVPKLTKIGNNEWEKKKNAVRNQLESIAKELIELQVARENMNGYQYQSDSDFQKDFEDDFEYEETKDQEKIISEIKKDMEKGVLIDRLICGDVGFGKTEIAMRAAFKTVYEGKQVAFMCPTTILSRQHYYSFKDRFAKYGIRIELLNRMVDPKKQNDIIKGLKDGRIDIVIGTHRLLNDEISYKDLGLLIIDEEQRFGVVHKEKIKKLKNSINVLTLTATPIPRTLQMAVSGIRQLSLLETPPKDRYPIQTYVLEYSDAIIKEAIYREISRGGQVFYLHNRVSDIYVVAKRIQKLVPEAKVCVGHGKMNRDELEDIISSYIDGTYNVLICTTIIETGIDIPNSNTLIVEEAYRLGLAQMYQIRGRVGRTDRIAYAYFTYQMDKTLTGAAEKRLQAIKEFTKIGSGYKIAVRDLAIRGAGDILGKEQSGFINSLGIDMYMKLLNEAVNKAKGIKEEKKANYRIDVSKHISREYVSDDSIIIYIHKEINAIETFEDKVNTISILTNRFGKLSDTVLDYIEERYLESQLRRIGVEKVIDSDTLSTVTLPVDVSNKLNPERILMTGYKLSDRIIIEYIDKHYNIKVKKAKMDRSWIYIMNQYLEKIC